MLLVLFAATVIVIQLSFMVPFYRRFRNENFSVPMLVAISNPKLFKLVEKIRFFLYKNQIFVKKKQLDSSEPEPRNEESFS